MKKITTIHGTVYLLDEENKQVVRVPSGGNRFRIDCKKMDYNSATGLDGEPYAVGGNLFITYPDISYPWTASTEIVSIEDYEEGCNHAEVVRDDYPGWQNDYCPKCGEKL